MSDRESFMAAIVADYDDNTPRLVYADWLDETGSVLDAEQAELIRRQCGHGYTASEIASEPFKKRVQELLRKLLWHRTPDCPSCFNDSHWLTAAYHQDCGTCRNGLLLVSADGVCSSSYFGFKFVRGFVEELYVPDMEPAIYWITGIGYLATHWFRGVLEKHPTLLRLYGNSNYQIFNALQRYGFDSDLFGVLHHKIAAKYDAVYYNLPDAIWLLFQDEQTAKDAYAEMLVAELRRTLNERR